MRAWLHGMIARPKSADPAAFMTFLARQSAFVAQKTAIDYCRVKAGRHERQMFADPDFIAALRHCRWQTFAGAVLDVVALAEAELRPHAGPDPVPLARALTGMGQSILDDAPAPAEERETLQAARERLSWHLAAMQAAPPLPADRLPLQAEAPLLATLPIHPDQRVGETPSIRGALRFHVVTTQQEMERGFDAPGLTAALLAERKA
jgi:hypothetical protein